MKFSELIKICKALGLEQKKDSYVWKGIVEGKPVRISIHLHSKGKDIPTGTLNQYAKDLGFRNAQEMIDFLK